MASVDNSQRQSMGNICQNYTGDYDPDRVYRFLDTVSFAYGSYLCRKNGIQGTAPTTNKTDENWFCCSIAGVATPEYLAAHDRVMNAAKQTELDRAAVELSEQNVTSMETNVEQMQADVQAGAAQVAKDKDSAAGYAQAAEVSRQATAESEANVNAQVTGFDSHVQEKTTDATGTIETARQQAVDVVKQQGAESVQGVIDDTEAYFDQKKTDALSEISDKTTEVVKSVTDEGTKQIGLVDAAGATQVAAIEQEGADQIANIQMEAESYIKREDANKLAFKGKSEGRSHHVEDSADWGFLGMQGYGESEQVQTTGAQLYDFANKRSSTNATANEDGYITITIDNTGGTAEKFGTYYTYPYEGLEPSKVYRCICEIKAVSGKGEFQAVNETTNAGMPGQFATKFAPTLAVGTYASNITARDSLTESMTMTRTYAKAAAGNTLSVTFRLSIIEDTTVTPDNFTYEPYTGGAPSPSPDYPQEIESKCQARQLLEITADDIVTTYGLSTTINPDGSLTIDGTPTKAYACAVNKNLQLQPGTYYISGGIYAEREVYAQVKITKSDDTTTTNTNRSFTIDGAEKSIVFSVYAYSTQPINKYHIAPMLNEGTEPGAWAPYEKYGLEYTVRTGQLVDYVNSYDTEYNGIKMKIDRETGVVTFTGSNTAASAVIYHLELTRTVKAGETVYLNAGNNIVNSNVSLRMYNKDTLVGVITDLTAPNKKASYTVPSDCNRLTVRFAQGATANITLRPMLAVSDQDWQPCAAQTLRAALDAPLRGIPVSSGGNVTIDGQQYIADYIDWERGKHVQRVTEEVFDGSANEEWGYTANTNNRFSIVLNNTRNPSYQNKIGYCNQFQYDPVTYADAGDNVGYIISGARLYIRFGSESEIKSVGALRTWLADNPLIFQLPLETPIETDIPPEELLAYRRLHAYHGTTNISNSDDVYTAVSYARDPDIYLNNKLAELSAAIIGG